MTRALLNAPAGSPRLISGTSLRLAPIAVDRWRVIEPTGRIIGHLDAVPDPRGARYRARRYHAATRAFREVGEFWSADDAVDALRFAR